jgi:hypothetical protein
MRITKNKLLYLVKQNIQEMAMDFDGPERPDPELQRDLQRGDLPLSIVPTPETNRADQNFFELLASERYREVVSTVREMVNYRGQIGGMNTGPLTDMMMEAHYRILELELEHKDALIALAIEVVKKEMGLPENVGEYINFIIDLKTPNAQGFNRGGQISPPKQQSPNVQDTELLSDDEIAKITPENREVEMELFQDIQNIDTTQELEESKYRLIKSIIAGASKKGHWMYKQLGARLREITGSDELFNLYGVMMSVNDLNYWQFEKAYLSMAGIAGKVNVVRPTDTDDEGGMGGDEGEDEEGGMGGDEGEDEGDDFTPQDERIDSRKTNIIVQAVNFPVIVHELLKGLMKTFALQGQPEKDMFVNVREKQEKLEYEIWDLRLGPSIYRRLNDSFPEDLLEDHNRELQNYILTEIFKLPAKKFLVLMKEVMGETQRGKRLVSLIYDGIVKIMNDEDYQEAIERYSVELDDIADNTNDDQLLGELNAIFGEKGFTLTKDDLTDDDEESDEDFLNQFK